MNYLMTLANILAFSVDFCEKWKRSLKFAIVNSIKMKLKSRRRVWRVRYCTNVSRCKRSHKSPTSITGVEFLE